MRDIRNLDYRRHSGLSYVWLLLTVAPTAYFLRGWIAGVLVTLEAVAGMVLAVYVALRAARREEIAHLLEPHLEASEPVSNVKRLSE